MLKEVTRKEEDFNKIESKLQTATREKSYLNANIASLVKELKSLRKGNEVLKTKVWIWLLIKVNICGYDISDLISCPSYII